MSKSDYVKCPRCNDVVHHDELKSVRGNIACLHCQLDLLWDYVEGTRRMIPEEMRLQEGPKIIEKNPKKVPKF